VVSSQLEEIDRLRDLVESLLILAQLDAGQAPHQLVDLTDLVLEAVDRNRPLGESRRVTLGVSSLEPLRVRGKRRNYGELRVVARGNLFEAHLNGKKLYEVEDSTFREPGKVGVWTKADSLTEFDDLQITLAWIPTRSLSPNGVGIPRS
jgi:hypothetical protein